MPATGSMAPMTFATRRRTGAGVTAGGRSRRTSIGSSVGLPHCFGGRLFCGGLKSWLFAFDTQPEIVGDARC